MARYKHSYDGERRTVKRSTKFTPSEAAALDEEAARRRVRWSDFSRQAIFHGIGMPVIAVKTRWDPRVAQAFASAAHAQDSIGNLLNPIARHLNSVQELGPFAADLREAIARHNDAGEMHKTALAEFVSLSAAGKSRWDPRVIHAFTAAGHAHASVGNLLNQIARHVDSVQELRPFAADLRAALSRHDDVGGMHKDALVHFGSL